MNWSKNVFCWYVLPQCVSETKAIEYTGNELLNSMFIRLAFGEGSPTSYHFWENKCLLVPRNFALSLNVPQRAYTRNKS